MMGGPGGCDSCGRGGGVIGGGQIIGGGTMSGAAKPAGGEVISEGYLPAPTVTPGPGE